MAATIPRAALDFLTEEVNGISADAQARVLRVLQGIRWTPENVAECRDLVLQALASVMPTYTTMAAQASADFYDAARELALGERLGAVAISDYDQRKTEGAVRGFVRFVLDGRVETFNDQVLQRIDYEMKRAAGISMLENGRADPAGPRFARVPTGSETCEFCLMLASRGFVYRSEKSAGALDHWHANCDCRIVASWDADTVEGYDPDALYRKWKRVDGAESFSDNLYSGRPETVARETETISAQYGEAWSGYRETGDFDSTVNSYLSSIQGSGSLSSEPGDKLWGKEVQLGSWLSNCGHEVRFKRPSDSEGDRTADMYVDGELWEAKRVTSGSSKKLRRRVSEASEQSGLVIVDLSVNEHFDMSAAKMTLADMLDDDSIERVMVVSGGRAEVMRK